MIKSYNARTDSYNQDMKNYIDEATGGLPITIADVTGLQTALDAKLTAVEGAAVADLAQDISAAYVEAEVQAISDKVDALLASLRAAGIIAT